MPRYLILAQSEVTANALGAWLELLGEEPLKRENDPRRIVWKHPAGRENALDAYETLVRQVEISARGADDDIPLNQVVTLVDAVRPADLSAVEESGSWDSLIALLILTFPEIRWVFGVASGEITEPYWSTAIASGHTLVSLLNLARRDPLFDPTGLRKWVRAHTNYGLRELGDDLELPMRQKVAAAIDEETSYAYLHGYTAYRFGCRADVVITWALMKAQFDNAGETSDVQGEQVVKPIPHGYWLLLEDMSLNFPDREKGVRLLHLDQRGSQCRQLDSHRPGVETSKYRVLVTTGQARPGDLAIAENRDYLRAKGVGTGKILFKPASGMFDLWAKAGPRGNAPQFCWPPRPPRMTAKGTGHGTPGKLMLVADALIARAQALVANSNTVGEAVQGAVLATDALELTAGRTPTTAVDALSLKHQFEVIAECQFSGMEYHIKMRPRLDEIAEQTAAICRWFHRRQRTTAMLNAEMHILNQLVHILRNYNQFDEEQVCMARIRRLHNTLWMRQKRIMRVPIRYIFWPLLRYLELLLSSFAVFVTVLLLWIIGLSFLYSEAAHHPHWGYGLSDAVTSFFSIGGPIHPKVGQADVNYTWPYVIVISSAIVTGFVHLGVFISHLYSIASRR